MKKCGRNDPCPCGSGKKFKKCCESTMIGGRYKATRLEPASAPQIASASKMTGLFHARVATPPTEAPKPIKPSAPKEPSVKEEERKAGE